MKYYNRLSLTAVLAVIFRCKFIIAFFDKVRYFFLLKNKLERRNEKARTVNLNG